MALVAFDRAMAQKGIVLKGILYNWVVDPARLQITAEMVDRLFGGRIRVVQEDFSSYDRKKAMFELAIGGLLPSIIHARSYRRHIMRARGTADPFYLCYAESGVPPYFAIDAALQQRRPLITVALEEGIGTYISDVHGFRNLGSARANHPAKKIVYKLYESFMHHWDERFDKILKDDLPHVQSTIFEQRDGALVVNKGMQPYFAEAARETFSLISADDVHDYSDAAIIVSGKFDVLGWADAEFAVLDQVVGMLKQKGLRVILRPHPGTKDLSRYDGLDVEMDGCGTIPFEAAVAQSSSKPSMIVGFASSALVFPNAMYDIPSISLEKLLEAEVSPEQANSSSMQAFMAAANKTYDIFEGVYARPEDYEELSSLVHDVKAVS